MGLAKRIMEWLGDATRLQGETGPQCKTESTHAVQPNMTFCRGCGRVDGNYV